MNVFKSALNKLVNLVTTKRCDLCGNVIEFNKTSCDECENAPYITSPICEYCGYSKDDCVCKKHKSEYKRIIGAYYYEDSIVSAVHNFKDNDMPFLSKRFSADIVNAVRKNYNDITFDFVTYVPLRRFREFSRGYNQSKLLANEIAKELNLPCIDCLSKIRYTGVQHHKSAVERKADVFGSYDVKEKHRNKIDGKTILLIDDVKTTGSTLNECAKMLNIYNANGVYAAAFAIAKKEKRLS